MPPKRKAGKSPKRARWFPNPPKRKKIRLTEPSPPALEERRQTVVPENLDEYPSSDSSSAVSTIHNILPQPPRRARNASSYPCACPPGTKVEAKDDEPYPAGEGKPEDYDEDYDVANTQPGDDDNAEYYSTSSSEESSSSESSTSYSSPEPQRSNAAIASPETPARERECANCRETYPLRHYARRELAREPIREHWRTCNTCERKKKRMSGENFDRLYGQGSEVFVDAAGYSGSEYDEDSEDGYSDGSESE